MFVFLFFLYSFNVVNNYVAIYGEVSADRPMRKNATLYQNKIANVAHGLVIFKVVQAHMTPGAEPDLWGSHN